jgi:DNA-binding response OmpR family regulator/DNA-binding CsgD family transcriptional regulator
MFERPEDDIVLIVDDTPENLALLHSALDDAGYKVLVATNGDSALQVARKNRPDVILLDVLMPGMNGFMAAQELKAEFSTRHIPIIFMTGLTETENIVAAFASGGADYVTKPVKPQEVLARIDAHLQNARQIKQALTALDAFGQATVAINEINNKLTWQTPQVRSLLVRYFGSMDDEAPVELLCWLRKARVAQLADRAPPIVMEKDGRRLLGDIHNSEHERECLITLREESCAAAVNNLMEGFHLTTREAEVLYWLVHGKTNRDIGDILGSSHRTVKKHLEHVYEKLGVETRTSAVAMALHRLQH